MENSKIEWTDHTFNPWIGCTKVSPGCQHCYAEELMDKRFGTVQWGPQGTRKRTSVAQWRKPLAWNKEEWWECRDCGYRGSVGSFDDYCPECRKSNCYPTRLRVFCASLSDVFEDRPELADWQMDLWKLIQDTPNLDWLLLTKRPENMYDMLPFNWKIRALPDNIWLGVSVENQEQADKRIPELLKISARIRFLSVEPLLGPVELPEMSSFIDPDGFGFNGPRSGVIGSAMVDPDAQIDWVIVGGESGPHARPMHPDWVRSIRDQCEASGTPFLFKQWGEWVPGDHPAHGTHWEYVGADKFAMKKVGKKAAGRLLDGREWSEYPR